MARTLARRGKRGEAEVPRIDSFLEFLTRHARVKSGASYVPYHFAGREALLPIVRQLDALLAAGEPDASLALCGGAQFGKTVLMLNLLAYLVAVRFRNVGYYLPDDDLVAGIVDGKLRPDVLDQIPWLARLLQVGKTRAPSGRAVNRKGAFLCTDGKRSALAFMRGLGKIPTSFSMDVVIQDEKDDLPEEHARFLSGRMTASDLRLSLLIGTQRYHGAGQNLAFTEGTQHIGLVRCPGCGARHNPETAWPGICRLRVGGKENGKSEKGKVGEGDLTELTGLTGLDRGEGGRVGLDSSHLGNSVHSVHSVRTQPALRVGKEEGAEAPRLTAEGHFAWKEKVESEKEKVEEAETARAISSGRSFPLLPFNFSHPIPYAPGQSYYLGCPDCGAELDRGQPEWHALAPERAAQRRWSYRLSQLLFPEIDLGQIVAAWQLAIRDPAQMNVFCTDRLALPRSSAQTLTPHDLAAARGGYALGKLDRINGINVMGEGEGNEELGTKNLERGNQDGINGIDRINGMGRGAEGNLELRTKKLERGGSGDHDSARSEFFVPSSTFQSAYGGLDLGDQCWFVARAVEAAAPFRARLLWIEPIAAERVRSRVPELFRALGLEALCVDAGPLRDLSRDLAFALNGLDEEAVASSDEAARNIFFARGGATLPLRWVASAERWENVRCVPVEFTQREGAGLRQKVARTQEGRIYPLLAANRDECIGRVIGELTSRDGGGLVEGADGVARRAGGARFLLPVATEETRGVLDVYERHLLAGSRQERSGDGKSLRFLDKCENHFLLATAYAALAELLGPGRKAGANSIVARPVFRAVGLPGSRLRARAERSVAG